MRAQDYSQYSLIERRIICSTVNETAGVRTIEIVKERQKLPNAEKCAVMVVS